MSEFQALTLSSLVLSLVGFLITWGSLRRTIKDHERMLDMNARELQRIQEFVVKSRELASDRIHELRDIYVSFVHFNEFVKSMKESQHDLKESVDKIIDLLSKNRV